MVQRVLQIFKALGTRHASVINCNGLRALPSSSFVEMSITKKERISGNGIRSFGWFKMIGNRI